MTDLVFGGQSQYNADKTFQYNKLSGLLNSDQQIIFFKFSRFNELSRYELFFRSLHHENSGNALTKVCSLLEWCFIISIGVSSDHSQLRCTSFTGGHERESD